MNTSMDKIVSLAKRRGFIFPSSDLYGGWGGFWDYGPLGTSVKNAIKKHWWEQVVERRVDMYGLDSSIILNPKVWEASGHTGSGFADPLKECKSCHHRFRLDDLKEDRCPDCSGELTEEKNFNILVKTFIGPVEDISTQAYLRGETAQGIFINFHNIVDTLHPKLPFGIAQIGKAFRNEITPGNFIFRSREFEQMEIEYFVRDSDEKKYFQYWKEWALNWFISLGLKKTNLRFYDHPREKLAHYARGTTDVEYRFPFGWSEIQGTADRGTYDLTQHAKSSGRDISYKDMITNEVFIPAVIEPSFGVERLLLALLVDAYYEEEDKNGTRVLLKFSPKVAPVTVAVFPLVANKENLAIRAHDIFAKLKSKYRSAYDDIGNIGKRYRRQDEIGTPWCVTIDYQTLEDESVTIRDRDTMKQERVSLTELESQLSVVL